MAFKHIILLSLLLVVSCNIGKNMHSEKKSKEINSISFKNLNIEPFNQDNINVLKQYLIGNARWDYREYHGKTFAIRRYAKNNKFIPYKNQYITKNNYNDLKSRLRVIVSFGKPIKFNDYMDYTVVDASAKVIKINTIKQNSELGKTGTYIIIKSALVNIEIFELSDDKSRKLTQHVINELAKEFYSVLNYSHEIEQKGVLPFPVYYPITFDSVFFEINNGAQPGIYNAKANIKNNTQGIVYIKTFDKDSGTQISAKTIKPTTKRKLGWALNTETLFYYQSDFKIMVGALNKPFAARIEFWFKDNNGAEKKLFEKEMQVESWKRPKYH